MIWIFAVVAVALVAIIVQLLLVYQRRAHRLRVRQEPLRQHIGEHLRSMEEETQKIRKTVSQRLEELEFESGEFREWLEKTRLVLGPLQETALGSPGQEGRRSWWR